MSGGTNMRLYYMGLTLFGACLVAHYCIKRIMERKERKELQQRVLAAAAKKCADGSKRDRTVPELCVRCLELTFHEVFVPCGHMCCCARCSVYVTICPLCCRHIDHVEL